MQLFYVVVGYICFILRKLVPWLSEWFFKFVHRYWFMLVYACTANYYVVQEDLDPATCSKKPRLIARGFVEYTSFKYN
jgi:hypothetical protein